MSEIRFRFAVAADAPRVVALAARVFRGAPSRAGWASEVGMSSSRPTDLSLAARWIRSENQWVLLGEVEGTLVAAAHVRSSCGGRTLESAVSSGVAGGGRVRLGAFWVDPVRARCDVTAAMLAELDRILRSSVRGEARELVIVTPQPALTAYFLRRGFIPSGKIFDLPPVDPQIRVGRPDAAVATAP
ncbi:hypothetical protein M2390_000556 [Mycetocola sp. BIGb0189]|uniref:hypothetical protein n=1 Tax=Mycetocola sp. BIGb0189 TaxID=2940604 RepID=UPI00216A27D7|nr:hypothetical protein [Mycetocola sp. BIGb0189]MCS4275395.1 hypothetical protein [Mycetocola sp. BIGb0189]